MSSIAPFHESYGPERHGSDARNTHAQPEDLVANLHSICTKGRGQDRNQSWRSSGEAPTPLSIDTSIELHNRTSSNFLATKSDASCLSGPAVPMTLSPVLVLAGLVWQMA